MAEESFVHGIEAPTGPECFEEVVLVAWVFVVESGGPSTECSEDICGGMLAEFAAGAVAGAVFGELEILQEFCDRLAINWGGLDEGTGGIGDPVDAAMNVIAVGVPGIVLHVADEDVVPIDDVE